MPLVLLILMVLEWVLAATPCKTAISEASQVGLSTNGTANGFNCGESDAGLSQYVLAVQTSAAGVITVTARNIAQLEGSNTKLIFTPYTDEAGTTAAEAADFNAQTGLTPVRVWKCSAPATDGIEAKYLPTSCR